MKVVILCGGKGTRLREKTETIPKPMVEIGNRPILWHIMKIYSAYNFNEFILALGYKGNVIKQYFLNYHSFCNDFTLDLSEPHKSLYHNQPEAEKWKITFADTGEDSMTGSRVARLAKYIEEDTFMLTYGDGVADVNLKKMIDFHRNHGRIGTVTGVHVPSRFGKLVFNTKDNRVSEFTEKPLESGISDYINGGFFIFNRRFFNDVEKKKSCILERDPLEKLARDGELVAYRHDGYWQCMDTFRDWLVLENLWQTGQAPWRTIAYDT